MKGKSHATMRTKITIKGLQQLLTNLTEIERKKAVSASKGAMEAIGRRGKKIEKTVILHKQLYDTGAMYNMTDYIVRARTKDKKGHYAVIGQAPNTVPIAPNSKKRRWSTLVLKSTKRGGMKRRQPVKYNYLVDKGSFRTGQRFTKKGANRGTMKAYGFVAATEKELNNVATGIANTVFKRALGL